MTFDYYYGTQADQFSFIRIPRMLLTEELFSPLSLQSKVLYSILLDRMSLSMRNGWFDEENRAYIIYQISEIQADLGFSKKKAMDYLSELEKFGLVEKKKRGFGLPSILYVKSFMVEKNCARGTDMGTSGRISDALRSAKIGNSEVPKSHLRSVERNTSEVPKSTPLEVSLSVPLNSYTNINQTDKNNTNSNQILSSTGCDEDEIRNMYAYAELIAENMELEILKQNHIYNAELLDGIYDLILEVALCKNPTMVIASNEYPTELVRSKFLKLNASHVEYAITCFNQNTTKIRNIKKYMLAVLFNAPTTMGRYYTSEVHHDMSYLVAK